MGGDATEPKRAAAPTPRAVQSEEKSLAEMAQRLEAALRRPPKPIEPPAPPAARSPARPETPPLRKPLLDAVNATLVLVDAEVCFLCRVDLLGLHLSSRTRIGERERAFHGRHQFHGCRLGGHKMRDRGGALHPGID